MSAAAAALLFAGLSSASPPPGASTTVGGPGGGRGTAVAQDPVSLAIGPAAALEVGDGTAMVVRTLSRTGGEHDVACAGNIATSGYGGDGGAATDASCDGPDGLAVDGSGDLFLSDDQNNRVRVVAARSGTLFGTAVTAGDMATIAGTGAWGDAGDGGPAVDAELAYPAGLALDAAGNLIVGDSGNDVVRVMAATSGTFYGHAMTAGDVYTVAGDGTAGFGGDGGPAVDAQLDQPTGVAVDAHGNLVVADLGNNVVRVVAAATGTFDGQAMTAGDIYTVAGDGTAGFGGDGGPATAAQLDAPQGVAVDPHGDLVVADTANDRVRLVAEVSGRVDGLAVVAGRIYTLAGTGSAAFSGDGGPAATAALSSPTSVAVDRRGDVAVADHGNERVRVIADRSGTVYGQPVGADDIETVAGTGTLGGFSGDGAPAAASELHLPTSVAADTSGDVAVADQDGNRVRFVPAASGDQFGQSMTAGDVYSVAGDGTAGLGGTGVPATSIGIDQPSGVAFDGQGNLVVASFADNQVFVVAARTGPDDGEAMTAGDLYLLAGTGSLGDTGDRGAAIRATLDGPEDVAVDPAGNVDVAEFYGERIRVVATASGVDQGLHMRAGDVYTVAGTGVTGDSGDGGPATAATFDLPTGVAVDRFGNVVVGDYGNERVRVVADSTGTFYGQPMQAGDVYTIAGDGTQGRSGDGGAGTGAELAHPAGIAVDAAGNAILADSANSVVRVVAVTDGRFYGQSMTAGDIYTVAGGGPASCAAAAGATLAGSDLSLSVPLGVADSGGIALEVADTGNDCVRQVVTDPEVPGPPGSVTATPARASASVRWAAPTDDGPAVKDYLVQTVGNGPTVRVRAPATSAVVTGLASGTTYSFTVTAESSLGAGAASADSKGVTVR